MLALLLKKSFITSVLTVVVVELNFAVCIYLFFDVTMFVRQIKILIDALFSGGENNI